MFPKGKILNFLCIVVSSSSRTSHGGKRIWPVGMLRRKTAASLTFFGFFSARGKVDFMMEGEGRNSEFEEAGDRMR